MSSACQQYAEKFPLKWLMSLTDATLRSLDSILKVLYRHGNGSFLVEAQLARELGVSRNSIDRAMSYFRSIGIIRTIKSVRDNKYIGVYVWITKFFSMAKVREALHCFFTRVPSFFIMPEMLLTEYDGWNKKKTKNNSLLSCLSRNLYVLPADPSILYSNSQKRRARMAQIDILIKKALQIEKALLARGETEAIDTAKFTAFSEECLDNAISSMKFATPRHCFRYFLSVCFEWCKNQNTEPNFRVSDHVRMHNLIDKSRPEGQTVETIKQQLAQRKTDGGTVKKESYAQQRAQREEVERKQQVKYSDAFEKSEAKKRRESHLAEAEGKSFDINNPFAAILVNTLKKSLKEYGHESEDGKRIMAQLEIWGVK